MKYAILVLLAAVCGANSLAAEPPGRAALELHILSADLHPSALRVSYELVNSGKRPMIVIAPDPDASTGNWPNVPFVRFDAKAGLLQLESYIAPPPDHEVEALYVHPVIRLAPGKSTRWFSLSLPLHTYTPYGEEQEEPVDAGRVKTVSLRLGYLACEEAQATPNRIIEGPPFEYVYAITAITCDGRNDILARLQSYAEDNRAVSRRKAAGRAGGDK